MAWHYVASQLLQQDQPGYRKVLYWDDSLLEHGELLLWLDAADEVARFQLSWRPFQESTEHLVEWSRESGLRAGVVQDDGAARGHRSSPTVRFGPLDREVLAAMRAYVLAQAPVLDARHRIAVLHALG